MLINQAAAIVAIAIELEGCIRCFCCQEVCPEEAITVREGWMHRLRLVR